MLDYWCLYFFAISVHLPDQHELVWVFKKVQTPIIKHLLEEIIRLKICKNELQYHKHPELE